MNSDRAARSTYDDPSYDDFIYLKCINAYERDVDVEPPEDIEYEDNDEERTTNGN
jgi:hypothetical protein